MRAGGLGKSERERRVWSVGNEKDMGRGGREGGGGLVGIEKGNGEGRGMGQRAGRCYSF